MSGCYEIIILPKYCACLACGFAVPLKHDINNNNIFYSMLSSVLNMYFLMEKCFEKDLALLEVSLDVTRLKFPFFCSVVMASHHY